MKNYTIPEAILKELLHYLSLRPYNEVAQAIDALQRLAEAKE